MENPSQRGMYGGEPLDLEIGALPPAYYPPQHVSQRKAPPPLTPHARALLQERSKVKLLSLRGSPTAAPEYPAAPLVDSSYSSLGGGGLNDAMAPLPPPQPQLSQSPFYPSSSSMAFDGSSGGLNDAMATLPHPQPHLSQSPMYPSSSSMAFDGSGARQGSSGFSSSGSGSGRQLVNNSSTSSSSGRQLVNNRSSSSSSSSMMMPPSSNRQLGVGSSGNLPSSRSTGGSGRVRITEAAAANIAADLGSSSREMSLAAFNDPQSQQHQQGPQHFYPGEEGEQQQQQQLPMILGVDTYGNPPSTRALQGKHHNASFSSSSEYTPSPYFSAPPPSTLPLSYYPPAPSLDEGQPTEREGEVGVGGGEEDDWDNGNYSQGGGVGYYSGRRINGGYRGGEGREMAVRGGGDGEGGDANAEMLSRLSQGFAAFFGTFFGSILNSLHPSHAQTLIKSTGPLISGLMGQLASTPIPGVGGGVKPLRSNPPPSSSSHRTLMDSLPPGVSLSTLEDGTAFMGSPWQSRDTFLAQRALLEQQMQGRERSKRRVGVVESNPSPPAPSHPSSSSSSRAVLSSLPFPPPQHSSSRANLSSATLPPPAMYEDRGGREDRNSFMPTTRGGYR